MIKKQPERKQQINVSKKILAFLSEVVYSIICWCEKHNQIRPVGQAVKTSPSHGENRGSIPLRAVDCLKQPNPNKALGEFSSAFQKKWLLNLKHYRNYSKIHVYHKIFRKFIKF